MDTKGGGTDPSMTDDGVITVGLVGVGGVGSVLLEQLHAAQQHQLPQGRLIRVLGLAGSQRMRLAPGHAHGLPLDNWLDSLAFHSL
jgi:aspartokinase/homoserine dehydrogenase 1